MMTGPTIFLAGILEGKRQGASTSLIVLCSSGSRSAVGGAGVLRPDLVDVGNEGAGALLHEVQQSVTVEVDPYQAAGDAAFVAGVGSSIGDSSQVYTGAFSRVTE